MRFVLLLLLWAGSATAQDFSGLARFDADQSGLHHEGQGISVELHLSQPVPWRVFTLDEPRRLVLDFREVDWGGARPEALLDTDRASWLRMGAFAPGWSRMVVDLAEPFDVASAAMETTAADGSVVVRLELVPTDAETFAATSGAPEGALWERPAAAEVAPDPVDGVITVAIDPGHGGIDPGATRDGIEEADVMLAFGLELAEAVARAGMVPVLTRSEDSFVPLQTRMSIAREAGADLFLSLHADALAMDSATGASIYTLAEDGAESASERLAERHERGDLLAGLDLSGQDDQVATVLMDLARLETGPAGQRLAAALVAALESQGAVVNTRPRRSAVLAVLQAADFPSVLVEAGFLSNPADRARLTTTEGRAPLVAGLVRGIQDWAAGEAALAPLLRK